MDAPLSNRWAVAGGRRSDGEDRSSLDYLSYLDIEQLRHTGLELWHLCNSAISFLKFLGQLASGKLPHNCGKSPFLIGKSW